jgi:hypothetical protein
LHGAILPKPAKRLLKSLCRSDVRWHDYTVVHPLPLTPSGHYASASKICKVSGDFWLRLSKDFDKVADTKFLLSHEVQKPQASVVTQGLKETFQAELLCCHVF